MKKPTDIFLERTIEIFQAKADPLRAKKMKSYMKEKFDFLGITSPLRNSMQRDIYKEFGKPQLNEAIYLANELWELSSREYQYFAMDLLYKAHNTFTEDSVSSIESLVLRKSWWDTVDFLAANIAANYFRNHPGQIRPVCSRWMDSGNIWLQRTCLLFQLKYKKETNTGLLTWFIHDLRNSDEFFIRKAIGWILREYSKTDPEWVNDFVASVDLKPLSKKEALKIINKVGKSSQY